MAATLTHTKPAWISRQPQWLLQPWRRYWRAAVPRPRSRPALSAALRPLANHQPSLPASVSKPPVTARLQGRRWLRLALGRHPDQRLRTRARDRWLEPSRRGRTRLDGARVWGRDHQRALGADQLYLLPPRHSATYRHRSTDLLALSTPSLRTGPGDPEPACRSYQGGRSPLPIDLDRADSLWEAARSGGELATGGAARWHLAGRGSTIGRSGSSRGRADLQSGCRLAGRLLKRLGNLRFFL